jgi:hypothetical protein
MKEEGIVEAAEMNKLVVQAALISVLVITFALHVAFSNALICETNIAVRPSASVI